jgi:hypothetical protein
MEDDMIQFGHGATVFSAFLVVFSNVVTLSYVRMSHDGGQRAHYVTVCKEQLKLIGSAINLYRYEHGGIMPGALIDLVPNYIGADMVICPFTREMARDTIKDRRREGVWPSYWYPPLKAREEAAKTINTIISYKDALVRRGNDTPVVICRDHREPWSLDPLLFLRRPDIIRNFNLPKPDYPVWDYPGEDVVVLRWDGRVDTTKEGGTATHSLIGTENDLLSL